MPFNGNELTHQCSRCGKFGTCVYTGLPILLGYHTCGSKGQHTRFKTRDLIPDRAEQYQKNKLDVEGRANASTKIRSVLYIRLKKTQIPQQYMAPISAILDRHEQKTTLLAQISGLNWDSIRQITALLDAQEQNSRTDTALREAKETTSKQEQTHMAQTAALLEFKQRVEKLTEENSWQITALREAKETRIRQEQTHMAQTAALRDSIHDDQHWKHMQRQSNDLMVSVIERNVHVPQRPPPPPTTILGYGAGPAKNTSKTAATPHSTPSNMDKDVLYEREKEQTPPPLPNETNKKKTIARA